MVVGEDEVDHWDHVSDHQLDENNPTYGPLLKNSDGYITIIAGFGQEQHVIYK